MLFSKKCQPSNVPPLLLGTHSLSKVNEHKHLGLLFTPNLSQTKHIAAITAKANRRLGVIKKYKYTISRKTQEIRYITFIRPILEYSDAIYDACSIEDTTKFEKVQLEAASIVTGTKFRTSSIELYLELGWLTLKNRGQFNKLSKLFTITKNQYPPYLKAILDTITNYHPHATRGHVTSQLLIPKCKNEFSKKSFFPSTVKRWNELDCTIRDSVNKLSLKMQYAPQNARLHLEYIQAILHAQPK